MTNHASDAAFFRDVDPEQLNALLDTDMVVRLPPGEDDYEDRKGLYDAGCGAYRDDPEESHLGMRLVPGNASGEDRNTTNRPAENLSPAEIAERVNEGNGDVLVPFQWVIEALDHDSVESLASHPHR